MKIKKTFTPVFLYIFGFVIVNSVLLAQNISFEQLSVEHGLSQSSVNCILQDSRGFLWFGTEDGLNRYDGYEFRIYKSDPGDPHSISDNYIRSLCEDKNGTIWVGTAGGGLNKYDFNTDKFTAFTHETGNDQSIINDIIWTIYQDPHGILWFGTDNGLSRLDYDQNGNEIFINYDVEPGNPEKLMGYRVRSVFKDKYNTLWIGTNRGLSKLTTDEKGTEKIQSFLPDGTNKTISHRYVKSIHQDKKGRLWFGTWGGGLNLYDYKNKTFKYFRHNPDDNQSISSDNIFTIYEDAKGSIWIGTWDAGLNKIEMDKNQQDKLRFIRNQKDDNSAGSISSNRIMAVLEDHSGVIWVGTWGGGLNKYAKGKNEFRIIRTESNNPNSLSSNNIRSFYEDEDGKIWIGTAGGGLNNITLKDLINGKEKFEVYKNDPDDTNSLGNDYVYRIREDGSGYMWIATYGDGLNRFDKESKIFKSFKRNENSEFSLSGFLVMTLEKDKQGKLWIGTYNYGLNYLNPDLRRNEKYKFIRFLNNPNNDNSLGNNDVRALHIDNNGTLWIGTWGGGLNKLEFRNNDIKQPVFTHYLHNPDDKNSISNDVVLAIHKDKNGYLWLGTHYGGLNKFDPVTEKFKTYQEKDGLPNNVVYGILQDGQDNLWLSTNKGLSRFNPRTEKFRNFDINDGLQSNEFNSGAYLKTSNGMMLFGGINGFNIFHPDSIINNRICPKVVLTDLQIFNKSVSAGEKIDERIILNQSISMTDELKLSYNDYVFSFEFAGLHFVSPEKNRYAYIMEGFEKEWNYVGTRRFVTYTNLPAGDYNFRVKAANSDGIWNEDGYSLRVVVQPPYWKTWWFIGFSVLSVIALFGTFYHVRTLSIRKHNLQLQTEINERQEVEKELLKSERNYREIFNASSDAIFLHDADSGKILEVNQTMLDMYGYNHDEVVSLNIDDLSSSAPPYTKTESLKKIKKAVTKGPQVFEWLAKNKNGELFWTEVALKYTEIHGSNRVLAVVRNIEDRKKAENELIKARNYINNILNSMPSVVIGVNEACQVTHWNEEAEKVTGISQEKATGQSLESVFPRMSREMDNIRKSMRSRQIIKDSKIKDITKNKTRYSDLTVYPLITNGTEGAVIRVDDVTERVRLEEMMIQSEKMLSVGGLAAGMAHEINNPLAGILQNAQVILNRLTGTIRANERAAIESGTTLEAIRSYMEKRRIIEMLEAINITGIRASKIVENMLSFSRKSESKLASHDITRILDDTVELAANDYDLKKKYDFRKIKIIREYEDHIPPVYCERSNIQQVFLNILKNGAQAMTEKTKDERLKMKGEPCFVLRVGKRDGMVRIEIEDNGPGMDEEARKRAFEPFFTTKGVDTGTGLGLSVSYFIISEQHNGRMSIESAKGKGAKVIIHLNMVEQ